MGTIIPLKNNEELYREYNLLNKANKVKQVNPNTCKKWLATLNLSPNYSFVLKQCTDGKWRIFICNV